MDKKIIIADDHPLCRAAMRAALKQILIAPAIYEVGSIAELQDLLAKGHKPNFILLDLQMPGAHGFSGLIFLRQKYPEIPIAIISGYEDLHIIEKTLYYGARGFIPKTASMETMSIAIDKLLTGKTWFPAEFVSAVTNTDTKSGITKIESRLATLTSQQFRVLGMISQGMLNKQIAFDLEISEATVKAHVTAIFKKLDVRNRTQAVIAIKELEINYSSPDSDEVDE
ncbi:MAG: response regulator transcription factor [Candidatus Endonucleobacter sp. (ex Gigantidas childressi)]|nr:response regulator transcription factor [Candidatus Endonucleobacter sp. (ex Gigantidas childressi)]